MAKNLEAPTTYVTFLRDPVERVISHYHYVRGHPEHRLHDRVEDENLSLADYVRRGVTSEILDGQVRQLVDDESLQGDEGFRPVDGDDVDEARRVLDEECSFVGVTESFDRSILLLARQRGWGTPYFVPQGVDDSRPRSDEVPRETLEVIRENTDGDRRIYEHACELLEKRWERSDLDSGDLEALRSTNDVYRYVYPVTHGLVDLARRGIKRLNHWRSS